MNLPDYETLLSQCLASVPAGIDKGEGSLIYMAVAPVCLRLAEGYALLESFYDLIFSDTSAGEYLDRLAGQYGILRKPASRALRVGEFKTQSGGPMTLPLGSRFYLENLFFAVEEELSPGRYSLRCETPGSEGNQGYGELLPVEYLADFGRAELTGLLIPGEDQEEDGSLRQRLGERLSAPAFGGNIADYREKARAIPGVGAVRVTPAASGGGTVRLTLLDSRYLPPEQALLTLAREKFCGGGNGLGLAPIGHTVEIQGAAGVDIRVGATIVKKPDAEDTQVQAAVEAAIEGYLQSLRQEWEEREAVIRISALSSRILGAAGVTDLRDVTINGYGSNTQLDLYAVPLFDRAGSALTFAAY